MQYSRRSLLQMAGATATAALLPGTASAALDRFRAIALQVRTDAVNQDKNPVDARARMMASIERIGDLITGTARLVSVFNGEPLKLIVLPEYFLTGFPFGETFDEWIAKAVIAPDGAEYDALSAIAAKNRLYLSGNAYESDPNFPEIYFQTSFILDPSGNVILRYRRLISLYTPTPYDVWDAYLDTYGLEAVFPVADTEIGRLACIASEEILYPELARCHAMRGAEVFCHSSSETGAPGLTEKDIAKRARAIENSAFVISANTGGLPGVPIPENSTDGMSKIVDYRGHVLASAGFGESKNADASLDLAGLRALRSKPAMANKLARQPFQAYAEMYANNVHHEANGFIKDGDVVLPPRAELIARQRRAIERLIENGVFAK